MADVQTQQQQQTLEEPGTAGGIAQDDPAGVAMEAPLLDITVITPHGKHVSLHGNLSTSDSLISVREYLVSRPETCHHTCYDFLFLKQGAAKGKLERLNLQETGSVNDYLEFSQIPALDGLQSVFLKMVPRRYTLRDVREHVWRLRSIVANPPAAPRPEEPLLENKQQQEEEEEEEQRAPAGAADDSKSSNAAAAASSETAAPAATLAGGDKALSNGAAETNVESQQQQEQIGSGLDDAVETVAKEGDPSGSDESDKKQEQVLNFDKLRVRQQKELQQVQAQFPNQTVPVAVDFSAFHGESNDGRRHARESNSTALTTTTSSSKKNRKKGKGGKGKAHHADKGNMVNGFRRCFRSICFSGFNPPPMQRQLLGDLSYLELCTEEGNTYILTATPQGFFVNASRDHDVFSPHPAHHPHTSHTLLELIGKVSSQFRTNWAAALAQAQQKVDKFQDDPAFLTLPWAPATPITTSTAAAVVGKNTDDKGNEAWLAPPPAPHTFDLNRSEETLRGFGAEQGSFGTIRDWNEEYQCCKELPATNDQERVFRARALAKMMYEFRRAARDGAISVMQGKIPPINPHDEPRCHVFVFNNIFFSFAVDVREIFSDCGGDRTAGALAMHDLEGVRILNKLDIPGLHTLATAVIDYLGHRIVAQSIVPGILQGESASSLEYGSVDRGRTLHHSKEMHEIMGKVAEKLYIETSQIVANSLPVSKGSSTMAATAAEEAEALLSQAKKNEYRVEAGAGAVEFNGPVDSKGIIGSDARHYILDVVRLTPKDPNFAAAEASNVTPDARYTAVFRPELVRRFQQYQQQLHQKKVQDAAKEAAASSESDEKSKTAVATTNGDKASAAGEKADSAGSPAATEAPVVKFDINVFTEHTHDLAAEDRAGREARVRQLADFLTTKSIPALGRSLLAGSQPCGDGSSLVVAMHKNGVNVRYLGALADWIHNHATDMVEDAKAQAVARVAARAKAKLEARAKAADTPADKQTDEKQAAADKKEEEALKSGASAAAAAMADGTASAKFVVLMAEIEMVARAVKGLVGAILRSNRDLLDAPAILYSVLLNCVVSANAYVRATGGPGSVALVAADTNGKRRDYTGAGGSKTGKGQGQGPPMSSPAEEIAVKQAAELGLTSPSFWAQVRATVQEKYRYSLRYITLPASSAETTDANAATDADKKSKKKKKKNAEYDGAELRAHRVQLIRRICQKCGFSISARDSYAWETEAEPVRIEDIVRVFPVCKDSAPNSALPDILHYLERGQMLLQLGQLPHAYEYVHEALILLYQICGASHRDTAVCYQTLAQILAHSNDPAAVTHQQRAVILFTKLSGADHLDTASALAHLGIYQHRFGDAKSALESLRRSLYVVQMAGGPYTDGSGALYQHLGLIYQDVGQTAMATACLRESLRCTRPQDAVTSAATMQRLAHTYLSAAEYTHAFEMQLKAHRSLLMLFGEDDPRTQQAAVSLAQIHQVLLAKKKFEQHKRNEAATRAYLDHQATLFAATRRNDSNNKNGAQGNNRSNKGGKKKKKKNKRR